MRGDKTTAIDPVQKICAILKKYNITDISLGIIVQVKNRRDHRISIKLKPQNSCYLLSVTGKRYKQELRIYNTISHEKILTVLTEHLGERLRILT